jgi:hypothetical protein
MTGLPQSHFLERFDEPEQVCPDPAVFQANLAALRQRQPLLAESVAGANLPAYWRCVRALDGFLTYRTEAPGEPPAWLAGTAAPATRAAGLLAEFRPGEHNVALPALAAGAELRQLLDSLPSYQAVYVFEPDITVLAAVLRTVRLADDIAAGRCIFVPARQAAEFIAQHLAERPGLMPPAVMLAMPQVGKARLDEIRRLCEQAAGRCLRERHERLVALAAQPYPAAPADRPRLALLALLPDHSARRAAQNLALAAKDSDWPVLERHLLWPDDVHPLVHAQALADFAPSFVLCVGHYPAWVKPPDRGFLYHWVLSATEAQQIRHVPGLVRLAASPTIANALRLNVPAENVLEWHWCCQPPTGQPEPLPDTVFIVADLPDDDPACYGIEQPTHQELWHYLRQHAARLWDTRTIERPTELLCQSEQDTGIRVADDQARKLLERAIERALIPLAVLGRIVETLKSEPLRVVAVGRGWTTSGKILGRPPTAADTIEAFADSVFDCTGGRQFPRPLAAIFPGSGDPLHESLVHAGVCGWPLVLHAPDLRTTRRKIAGVLTPERHCWIFAGAKELRAVIRKLRDEPAAAYERADQAARHLAENHSYRRRLRELVRTAGAGRGKG